MRFWLCHPNCLGPSQDQQRRPTSSSLLGLLLDTAFILILNTNIWSQASQTSEGDSCTCKELMAAGAQTSRAARCQDPESTSGPDHPLLHLCLPSLKLRPGHSLLSCTVLYERPSPAVLQPSPGGHGPLWSGPWPTERLPDMTPDLPCHYGLAWRSIGPCLTWVTVTGPNPDSQAYTASLAWTCSSSLSCLTVWSLHWCWLPSPGWSCSPDLDTVRWSLAGKIPTLPVMLSPVAPGSLSLTEQPAPAGPWQLRSNCSIFCVNRSQDLILSWTMTADQTMIAESEIKHSRQENTAQLSKADAQFGLNGRSFKYLAWP